jgi:hypothetical protein
VSKIVFDEPAWWRRPGWQAVAAALLTFAAWLIWWTALVPVDHGPIVVQAPTATAPRTPPQPAAPAAARPLPLATPPLAAPDAAGTLPGPALSAPGAATEPTEPNEDESELEE